MNRGIEKDVRGIEAGFYVAVALLFAFKLWLIHDEKIIGSATQFDALWYVRSATNWYWFTPYSWTAFVRPCAYPLWIALVHLCHIPLRPAIEVFQLGGALCIAIALRSVGLARGIGLGVFAVMAFHPAGYQLDNYTMSDTLYAALLWYLLAGFISLLNAPGGWRAIATGVITAAIWNTREEGSLAITIILIFCILILLRARNDRAAIRRGARAVAVVCGTAGLLIFGIYSANKLVFRSFARSEMAASTFQALYHSLLRIEPREPKRYAPITNDTLERAYQVSPTFANLRKQLRGPLGEAWRTETFHRTGVPHEIGVGWIVWATRHAASTHGYFQTPGIAHHFFKNAAREIKRACDEGRLPTRLVLDGFLDPLVQAGGIQALPHSSLRIVRRFFAQWPNEFISDDGLLTHDEIVLYNRMTLRPPERGTPAWGLAARFRDVIGKNYSKAVIALLVCAVVLSVLSGFYRHTLRFSTMYRDVIILIAVALLGRALLFAWLDATAFDGTQDRFLFPILPLLPVLLILFVGWATERKRPVGAE